MRKGIIIGFGLLLLALPASAQVAEPQALTIVAENVTARSAERTELDEGTARPGDVIEYRLTFTNHQDGPVTQVVLNDPIPVGVVFVPGSVTASREDLRVEYSIDSGATWSTDPKVEAEEAGEMVLRPAPAEARVGRSRDSALAGGVGGVRAGRADPGQDLAEEVVAATEALAETETQMREAILGGMDAVEAYNKFGTF